MFITWFFPCSELGWTCPSCTQCNDNVHLHHSTYGSYSSVISIFFSTSIYFNGDSLCTYGPFAVVTFHLSEILHLHHVLPTNLLPVPPTDSSARRAWVCAGSWNRGRPWRSFGRFLLTRRESNFTRRKCFWTLCSCFCACMMHREAVNTSEYGDHVGWSPMSSPWMTYLCWLAHSSALSKALWVRTSTTWLFGFSSCEWNHGRGPRVHCSFLLHWSTDTLKPWLQRWEPSWQTNSETRSSTSGGLSSTTWAFLLLSERKNKILCQKVCLFYYECII